MIPSRTVYRIGEVEVDSGLGLRRGEENVHLRARALQVLLHLIENRDRVVSRDELIDRFWGGAAVTDDAVAQCVADIRRAFGDSSRQPQFVQTLPKIGFRFIGPVDEGAPAPPSAGVHPTSATAPECLPQQPVPRAARAIGVAVAISLSIGTLAWVMAPNWRPRAAAAAPADIAAPPSAASSNLQAYQDYLLAVERADDWDNAEAIRLLEKAIAADPEFAMAYARIGYVLAVTESDIVRARTYLERALTLPHRLSERDRMYVSGWLEIANMNYPAAIETMRRIIARHPSEVEAHLRLGRLLIGENRLHEAIEALERGRTFARNSDNLLRELGMAYLEVGEGDRSIDLLKMAARLEPSKPVNHERLGTALRWLGQYDQAAASYQRVLELADDHRLARFGLGHLEFDRGRYRGAIRQYEGLAERLRARCGDWLRFKAITYHRLGDLALTEQLADAAYTCDSGALYPKLLVALERNQVEEAQRIFEKSGEAVRPTRGQRGFRRLSLRNQAMIALRMGRADEAISLFTQTQQERPLFVYIERMEDGLANAHLELGQFDEAIAEYRRVLRLNPNDALSRYHLALALDGTGSAAAARAELTRFVELWRDADADVRELVDAKRRLAGQPASRSQVEPTTKRDVVAHARR